MSVLTNLHEHVDNLAGFTSGSEALWAVGSYSLADNKLDYPVAYRDLESDVTWAQNFLASMGVDKGQLVLLIGNTADWVFVSVLGRACEHLGCPTAPAMAMAHDAYRVEMFTRRLNFSVVFGVNESVLDGLDQLGKSYADVFGHIKTILATPGAVKRLKAAGIHAHTYLQLAPLMAFIHADTGELSFNRKDWMVESVSGSLHVSSFTHRACHVMRLNTGIKASLKRIDEQVEIIEFE